VESSAREARVYYGYRYRWLIFVVVAVTFFFGGIYNLFSREGRYDAESNRIMTTSSIFGITVGGLMLLYIIYVIAQSGWDIFLYL
jgi:hypothetical protein